MSSLPDAFTAAEIARASGVPREAVDALVRSGSLRTQGSTPFFTGEDAIRAGHEARQVARLVADARCRVDPGLFTMSARRLVSLGGRRGLPTFAASFAHATLVILMIWLASRATETAPGPSAPPSRLVFLALPGEGGGGGGGGLKNPLPAPRLENTATHSARSVPPVSPDRVLLVAHRVEVSRPIQRPVPRPEPLPQVQEPLPSRILVAPVAASGRDRHREGEIEAPSRSTESLGPGTSTGAGTGRNGGNGSGVGAGIGPGVGGGTGGGPFRAGSGIEPPRLLREVKALYTDDARRRGVTGDVVLEIVVKHDGTVDEVTVLRGLGAGLDQRAVAAVREWRFAPARRQGEPVDVIVEVAVEFALR